MCELFAISTKNPSTIQMSLAEFSRHGGLSAHHKDGWGITWYESLDGKQLRLVKEAGPAASSASLLELQGQAFLTTLAISHVRRATRGDVAERNSQPFARIFGTRWHSFAHNGDLPGIEAQAALQLAEIRPAGETDSEQAFCALLERVQPLWAAGPAPPLGARLKLIECFAADLRRLGPANFIYSDGDALFAHADRRHQKDGSVSPPGMWRLSRHCEQGGLLQTAGLHASAAPGVAQDVVLFASVPLTDEDWLPMASGQILVARLGQLISS